MYFYKAYGLDIHSALPLPEVVPAAETEADVVIQFGQVDRSLMKINRLGTYLHVTAEEVSFFWDEVGAFLVRNGKEIIIDPLPEVEERMLRLPLLGVVLAVLLHQREFLTLHASAVEINGGAAVFLGGRGWGKSTLAATLCGRGHNLVSDDLVALNFDSVGHPVVIPGFPQLKLLPEAAAAALGDDPDTLPTLAIGYEKRARRIFDKFSQKPLPLMGVYQLSKGPDLKLIPLQPQEAIVQLIGNSYIARSVNQLLQGAGGFSHFHQCMNLANKVPIYCIERPQALELVPALAQLIEENLAQDIRLTKV